MCNLTHELVLSGVVIRFHICGTGCVIVVALWVWITVFCFFFPTKIKTVKDFSLQYIIVYTAYLWLE